MIELHSPRFIEPYGDSGHISRLFIYPIKSCAGIEVKEALLIETGFDLDRAWMVVDEDGVFVSQRRLPRMALITSQMKTADLIVRAPGMLALHVSIERVEEAVTVQVWNDNVKAYDMGKLAAQWFSDFLGQAVRLVRFDPEQKRLSNPKWTGEVEAENQFSDGYPLLMVSEASLDELNLRLAAGGHASVGIERFRPNIVVSGLPAQGEDAMADICFDRSIRLRGVKPCPRCPIPNIDPQTALSHPAVGDTLRTYRANPLLDGAVTFGMNMVTLSGIDQSLRVGQSFIQSSPHL
jgi:uncharacterized protein YcbX